MADSSRQHGPFRTALSHRQFRYVIAGTAMSTAGDWLYNVALLVFVFEQSESASWVALATIARLAPYVLFGAIGGALADRHDRRQVMLVSDLARAGVMVVLAGTAAAGGSAFIAIGLAFVSTAFGAAYIPAVAALTPAIVGERDLAAANTVRATVENVAVVVGPAAGGLLLLLGSTSSAFLLNGVTFLLSAMFVTRLRPSLPAGDRESGGVLADIADGWRALRTTGSAKILVFMGMLGNAIYGLETVMLLLVSEQYLDAGANGVGYFYAALGIGGVAGSTLTTRMANSSRASLSLSAAVVLSAAPAVALAVVRSPAIALALALVQGGALMAVDVVWQTMLQRSVRPSVLARVFGIADALIVGSILAGSLTAPLLVGELGLGTALVVGAGLLGALGLLALPALLALDRQANARRMELAPTVALLAELRVFEGVSPRALELLAANAVEAHVPTGQWVVREGEPADDFYVIRSGELDVTATGERGAFNVVNRMGPGDYFGEIGLLERRPRTASVQATSACDVYRITGEAFLEAVGELGAMTPVLREALVTRLGRTHPSSEVRTPAPAGLT